MANKQGAKVIEVDLGTNKSCGKCIGNIIIINNRLSEKEKYCVLIEELCHYKLTIGNITNQNNINNRKQEILARQLGYNESVGLMGLINSFEHGCIDKFEIAEYLNVTIDYLNDAIEYYRNKYGVMQQVDNYLIYFIPSLHIGKAFN